MKREKYILLETKSVAKRKEIVQANYVKNSLIFVYGFILACTFSVFSNLFISANKRVPKNRFFHRHLYSNYSQSIVIIYSIYSISIVNLYSPGLHFGFICRSSVVHLSFSRYSVYSKSNFIQTISIVVWLVNPIALHLGRPPPKNQHINKKPPTAIGG